jgi:hypothetical protein
MRYSRSPWQYQQLRPSYWFALFYSHGSTHLQYASLSQCRAYSDKLLAQHNLKDGDIVSADKSLFYVLQDGARCHIPGLSTFIKHGWEFSDTHYLSEPDLNDIKIGPEAE